MCGIAGVVAVQLPPVGRTVVDAMVRSMARRGPDSEGTEAWPCAILGHRRLAVLDLSEAGRQPMLSDDGQIGVVFNGCIYNFQDLRRELESRGCGFRSHTDTEILVHGYREWGVDALVRRLRGMFAFAIWDERQRKLTLARDRLGVKPLYYALRDGEIAFASTVTALHEAGLAGEINPQAVLDYLEFGYVTDDRAIFSEAAKLPAASILEWQGGNISQRSYWSLPEPAESSTVTFEEAVDETERLLVEAVRFRLYADVPIGVLLSGGVDSALVCWALSKLNANVKAFTVSAPGDPADEAPAAAETARILGIPHEMVTLPEEHRESIEDLVAAYGEPFGCSSALGMLRLSSVIKPMATVLLTGDGGDDVFLGYPFHLHFWMAQRLARALPEWAEPLWGNLRPHAGFGPLRRGKHFLDYATGGLGAVTRAHDGLPFYERRDMFGERLAGRTLAQRTIPLSLSSARRLLPEVLGYDQKTRFVGEFMTKVDGGAMHYALEARSPFLDQGIWEFAAALPFRLRLRGGTLKAVLREMVRRRVGAAVATRRKRGFTVPVERWLLGRWKQSLDDLARNSRLEQEGWIRRGKVRAAVEEAMQSGIAPTQLWHMLVLEHWLRAQAIN